MGKGKNIIKSFFILCGIIFIVLISPIGQYMKIYIVGYIYYPLMNILDIKINGTKYNKILDTKLNEKYGLLSEIFVKKVYIGDFTYEIHTLIMDKTFEVWIDNRTHEVFGDNFYDVLSTDSKFQHLYSNYIKEQIGLEDENVELEFFGRGMDEKIYIDFDNITQISKDYREIFENTSNYFCCHIKVKNINDLIDDNKWMYAKKYKELLEKGVSITGRPSYKFEGSVILYKNDDFEDNDRYYFRYDLNNIGELYESEF